MLALLLAVIILVFFVPVKYKSSGIKNDDTLDVTAWVTYLNPIVRVRVHYPDDIIVQVKIFGFTIYPAKPKKAQSDISKEEGSHEVSKEETQKIESISAVEPDETIKETKKEVNSAEVPKQSSAKNSTLDTVGYYASLLKENKALILNVTKTVLKACKTILPRQCCIKAVLGTGKADLTGQIYGAYCSIRDFLPGEIYLEPVWTESHLEGEYSLKGKIRFVHFAAAAIKIILNKEVRLLIKKLRRV